MNFIRFSVLLVFATHLNSCGFFNKRKNNDSVPQTEWALHRPKLNDSLAKLKSVSSDRTLSAEHKFSQQWSAISDIFLSEEMQSANLLNLDFKKLKHDIEDIQSQNINSIYSQVNFDRKKPLIRLESHRAIRVPVKSYCLNHHRDAPSSSVRYKISTPKNESVLRRLILKYADDQYPTTEDLQGLIWKLEDSSSMVSSLQTLQKILKFYNIQFQNESVGELEKSSQLQEALVRLDLDKYADISQLEIDLISQNGFKSSDLIIYNKSTTTVDIHLSHLQQRFVPQYDLTTRSQVEPMAFGANGFSMMQNVEEEPHSNVQNILTSGHDKSRSDTTIEEYLNWLIIYLNLANDLQTHLKSKPNLENDVKNFSFGLFDLISHLLGHGEYDTAASLKSTLLAVIMYGLALDQNDFVDIYEAITNKDLVTGKSLTSDERAIAALGVVMVSGAGIRKGIDALGQSGLIDTESYNTGKNLEPYVYNWNKGAPRHIFKGNITKDGKIAGGLFTTKGLDNAVQRLPHLNPKSRELLANGVERVSFEKNQMTLAYFEKILPGQTEPGTKTLFPRSWSLEFTAEKINEVAKNGKVIEKKNGKSALKQDVVTGLNGEKVKMNVILGFDGKVSSAYPDWNQ